VFFIERKITENVYPVMTIDAGKKIWQQKFLNSEILSSPPPACRSSCQENLLKTGMVCCLSITTISQKHKSLKPNNDDKRKI
jgi:hypothetical protein